MLAEFFADPRCSCARRELCGWLVVAAVRGCRSAIGASAAGFVAACDDGEPGTRQREHQRRRARAGNGDVHAHAARRAASRRSSSPIVCARPEQPRRGR